MVIWSMNYKIGKKKSSILIIMQSSKFLPMGSVFERKLPLRRKRMHKKRNKRKKENIV